LQHLPKHASLSAEESEAIKAFEEMANDIAKIKVKLTALRPRKSVAASS
jgi:hypothetical protein